MISKIKSPFLEGDYAKRRKAYVADRKDIKAKKAELVDILKQLVKLNT